MWEGDGQYRLAPSLITLIAQLIGAYPDPGWQTSPQTGTIGDAAHRAEGSASDHNPWLANTVRAVDIASLPKGPDCEALFQMVNRMYAARDSRVYPTGYAIFKGRITDWDNPGGFHAQQGDPHDLHVHISVSRDPAGYNSTAPWPISSPEDDMQPDERAALFAIRDALANGVAPGQKNLGGTVAATLPIVQGLVNKLNALAGLNAAQAGQIAGLAKALSSGNVDLAAVQAAAKAGTDEALAGYKLTLDKESS